MDDVLEAFVTTVKAEKQMRDLCIDTPDLSVQYEAMLTDLKQHNYTLEIIKHTLECANVTEVDFQMDWIRDMWNHINLLKYKVTMLNTFKQIVEVWATDEANAKTIAANVTCSRNIEKVNATFEVEEVGK